MYGQSAGQTNLENICNIIGILGGKGGVGKSTVTVNVALALRRAHRRVAILDADVYGPSVVHLIGEVEPPKLKQGRVLPARARGISLVSTSLFQEWDSASAVRAPIANRMIDQFLGAVDWGHLDDLLIDFPPGTGDIPMTLVQKAQLTGVVVVTTPQEVALLDVRKSVQMCNHMGVALLGIVENMSYLLCNGRREAIFGEGGGKRLADECQVPLLGQIPLDPQLGETGDEGACLFDTDAPSRSSFEEIAARLRSRLDVIAADQSHKNGYDKAIQLRTLKQKTPTHFEIVWSDDLKQTLRSSDVQKQCPCARCLHAKQAQVHPQVMIISFKQVGNYALKIQFTQGCSQGIYPFGLLRSIAL